ncbi:hypothetical protein ACFV4M_30005 [Kitasatospora indigofera]
MRVHRPGCVPGPDGLRTVRPRPDRKEYVDPAVDRLAAFFTGHLTGTA